MYAPAIEKGIITENTKILDEKINISGYTPENADKKYHGYISASTALANSYNIPAVKLLNELGINEAKAFAEKLNFNFSESDNHLALALGGFENGLSLKTLCDAYTAFARNGKYQSSSFISKITKNGKTIYERQIDEQSVMSPQTAQQINNMLYQCSQSGTGKRLNGLGFHVCSKTGTVGKPNSNLNTLAYNVCYTPNHTIITMIQGNNLPSNINGSTYPTMINKDILNQLYKTKKPDNFSYPETKKIISSSNISLSNFDNNLSSENDFKLTAINIKNHKPILCFTLNNDYNYYLIRTQKNKEETIASFLENNDKNINFTDASAKNNSLYSYKLKICSKDKNDEFYSNEIKLKTF